MKRYLCSLVALGLLQSVTGPVKAQPTYNFTTIDVPVSLIKNVTHANGINASGQIVGVYYDDGDNTGHGFLFDQGSYTRLDVPSFPNGINASGQIVGSFSDAAGWHGFLLDQGSYTTLDVPGATITTANGINDSGQIVGSYIDAARKRARMAEAAGLR
jgi:uncharacterized membrane protein